MEIKNESKRMLKLLFETAEQNSKTKDDKQGKKHLKLIEKNTAKNEKNEKILVASQNWENYIKNNNGNSNENQKNYNNLKKQRENIEKIHPSLEPNGANYKGITPIVSLDCEMVMTKSPASMHPTHEIARVSIVNYNRHVLFDEFIKPKFKVTNYLTWVSGITAQKIYNCKGLDFWKEKIWNILKDKIIVGHTLSSDFQALGYTHNSKKLRDLKGFDVGKENGKVLSLKKMTLKYLNIDIQTGQHSSVEDAQAAMKIYMKFEKSLEDEFRLRNYSEVKSQLLSDLSMQKHSQKN